MNITNSTRIIVLNVCDMPSNLIRTSKTFLRHKNKKKQRCHRYPLLALCGGNPAIHGGFPWQSASNAESVFNWWLRLSVSVIYMCVCVCVCVCVRRVCVHARKRRTAAEIAHSTAEVEIIYGYYWQSTTHKTLGGSRRRNKQGQCEILPNISLTHLPWTKLLPFRRQYFQMHVFEWKNRILWKISPMFVPGSAIDNNPALI